MSASNTPNRIRQNTTKTTRAYESSDGGTPSPARFRSKRNCTNEVNQNSPRRNKYHPYQTVNYFDENANDPFHDENHKNNMKPSTPNNRSNKLNLKNEENKTPKRTFEEEQQELQKSLSKDWCDKMDNEEAEEKKLYSFILYLKKFPVHANKTTEEILASIECCPKELLRRQKEISKGKLSKAYQTYATLVPRKSRTRQHPRTPCKYAKMSRRGFDGAIKAWRRKLHEFGAIKTNENGDDSNNNTSNNNDDDSISISSSQRSDGYSTPSSASISMEDIDENFLPDLYDFEESLTLKSNNDIDIELKFGAINDFELADSMDTIVNNVDSRSAMAFE